MTRQGWGGSEKVGEDQGREVSTREGWRVPRMGGEGHRGVERAKDG